MLSESAQLRLDHRLCRLSQRLNSGAEYGMLAVRARGIAESVAESDASPGGPGTKLLRRGWERYRGKPAWGWFGDIDHDKQASRLYDVFVELVALVQSDTTATEKKQMTKRLRKALAIYLESRGHHEHDLKPKGAEGNVGESAADRKPKRRGRPKDTDPKADKRIWDAWHTGSYRKHEDLAKSLSTTARHAKAALDRQRKRESARE